MGTLITLLCYMFLNFTQVLQVQVGRYEHSLERESWKDHSHSEFHSKVCPSSSVRSVCAAVSALPLAHFTHIWSTTMTMKVLPKESQTGSKRIVRPPSTPQWIILHVCCCSSSHTRSFSKSVAEHFMAVHRQFIGTAKIFDWSSLASGWIRKLYIHSFISLGSSQYR